MQGTPRTAVVALAVVALAASGCEDRNAGAADQPATEQSATAQPATTKQSATEHSAANQPTAGQPAAEGSAPQEPTESAATRAALPGLFAIMLELQGDMGRVSRGLWLEAYDTIAAGAQAIADHPQIPPDEAATIADVLGPDMARFKTLDTRVHDLSVELAEAARAGDMATVLARDAELRQGCVECHSAFRERLRSELR